MSSPMVMKSRRCMALSSSVLSPSLVPGMKRLVSNSLRSFFILSSPVFRPSAVRPMPTYSHMMWPSSLCMESTERLPWMPMRRSISAPTAFSASANSGRSVLRRGHIFWSAR